MLQPLYHATLPSPYYPPFTTLPPPFTQVRLAMERNPFLARRLARVVGVDTTGLSYKVR